MSVAGLLDAMRSDLTPATRLVWMCLENHANGERFWSVSVANLATELSLSEDSVSRAVCELAKRKVLRLERHRWSPTTYYMLRAYPSCQPKVVETAQPQIADSIQTPPPQNADSILSPYPQIADSIPQSYPQFAETIQPQIADTRSIEAANCGSVLSANCGDSESTKKESTKERVHVLGTDSEAAREEEPEWEFGESEPEPPPPILTPPLVAQPKLKLRRPPVPHSRMTDDWTPDEDSRRFATAHGVDHGKVTLDVRNYWASRSDRRTAAQWQATFRSRVLFVEEKGWYALSKPKPYSIKDDPLCGMQRL